MSIEFIKDLELKYNLRVVDCFKSGDYGPLSLVSVKVKQNFKNSNYLIVKATAVTSIFKLKSFSRNFYCLIENRSVKDAFIKAEVIIPFSVRVPMGFRVFCGEMKRKKSGNVDVVVVYVPDEYLRDLIEGHDGKVNNEAVLEKAFINQGLFFQKYIDRTNQLNKEYLDKHLGLSQTLKCLNNVNNCNMPQALRSALTSLKHSSFASLPKCFKITDRLPETTYKVHTKALRLPDGRFMTFKLELKARYDGLHQFKAKKRNRRVFPSDYELNFSPSLKLHMYRHRAKENNLTEMFHRSRSSDQSLSKINQVYYVTKQVPQHEFIQPKLTYLPIIQQAPNASKEKNTFMSSALLSSVHSIDLDSVKISKKYFHTVLGPKKNAARQASAKNTVINLPQKTTELLMVKNAKSELPFRLRIDAAKPKMNKVEMKLGSMSTPTIRDRTAKSAHSRMSKFNNSDKKKELTRSAVDITHKSFSNINMVRSSSSFMLASSENFKNYRMVVKKLDRTILSPRTKRKL